ncbi:MAG: heme-degrading monooxygenase HmoA [Rhodothermales bacterium]|jgi:heme-degrading monooxygenase HmoA
MMYRSQILVCNAGKRDQMLMALDKGLAHKPNGMLAMAFSADAHDDNTIVIVQTWESKDSCTAFQASLSAEQAAGFAALVASKAEGWHREVLSVTVS